MALQATLHAARERRRAAQAVAFYRGLVAAPADLGSAAAEADLDAFTVLASGEHAVSCDAALDASEVSFTIASAGGTRVLGHPALEAGQPFSLGFLEPGETVTVTRGATAPSGNLSIQVRDYWRRGQTVATGSFT